MSNKDPKSPVTASLETMVDELSTLRDELRVQADLAGKDLRDFVEKQEVKLQGVQSRLKAASSQIEDRVPALKASALSLVDDVRKTIKDARARLSED